MDGYKCQYRANNGIDCRGAVMRFNKIIWILRNQDGPIRRGGYDQSALANSL